MVLRRLARRLGYLIMRLSDLGMSENTLNLTGDRNVEWSWVAANLPEDPGAVLDFGSGDSLLGLIAAMKGGNVTSLDLQKVSLPYSVNSLVTKTGDILDIDFGNAQFDLIINCSTIEHVGLAGRYGSKEVTDGDLIVMRRLRRLLKAQTGLMILTVPVGIDSVIRPWHRVYGADRLRQLLEGFAVRKKEFWSKRSGLNVWIQVGEKEALAVQPSESFYALGLFALRADARAPERLS